MRPAIAVSDDILDAGGPPFMLDIILIRGFFVLIIAWAAYALRPFQLNPWMSVALGVLAGCGIVLFELRLRDVSLKRLIGSAFGSVLGIIGAYFISLVVGRALPQDQGTVSFVQILVLLVMWYVGLVIGANKAAARDKHHFF